LPSFFVFFVVMGAICIFPTRPALANNLAVSNAQLVSHNSANGTVNVRFDLGWDNSWRNRLNRDAVWVFVKYSTDSGVTWKHAHLKTAGVNPAGVSVGTGTALTLTVPSDKLGAFAERSGDGIGRAAAAGVELVWDFAADGLQASDTARVKVFGIEMVYVPEGSFYAGDHATASAALKQGSADTDSWLIQSNSAVNVSGATADGFYYQSAGNGGEDSNGSSFTISAAFPKGFGAFYVMKHEVTEGLWAGFFNTLTAAQKSNRDLTAADGKSSDSAVNRNTIDWTSGAALSTREDRACGFLSWMDGCAFADWAALRPLTELEFEKMARGKEVEAVSGEFVWGNLTITAAASISGAEDGSENIDTDSANAHYSAQSLAGGDGSQGPLRSGIFATQESTKTQAGAGFYGAMELAGNLSERLVTIGNAAGRAFLGSHGDGSLTTRANYEGNATNLDWPGLDTDATRGVTGAEGSGFRGGSWADAADRLRTSDRQEAAMTDATRQATFGFRAGRSAQ
jgi:hypothetical protein